MQLTLITIALILIKLSSSQEHNNQKFAISIERKLTTDNCILGYLTVNGTSICHTMELPFRGNINDISSIPRGKYDASIRTDRKLGWRIELKNVPGRQNVQIHIGNYTADITGCTLVGKTVDTDNCSVGQSKDAIREIERAFVNFKSDLCLECVSSPRYELEVEYK